MLKAPARNEFAAEVEEGPILVTPGVVDSFKPWEVKRALERHLALDWTDMDDEDAAANLRAAMEGGSRVFSAFRVRAKADERCDLWIITEADRSSTTILLPEEY
jgi:hypothetical protein